MFHFNNIGGVNGIFDQVVNKSEFNPTVFKIYDKSTKDVCNRLILVSPFEWYIWACRGELYIINPEGGLQCPLTSCSAVRVFKDQFVETCLDLDLNSIVKMYTEGKSPLLVPYEITKSTFTILSALNILVKKWVTFDVSNDKSISLYQLPHYHTSILQ